MTDGYDGEGVDGCAGCESHTLKVGGLCLRHYVAREYLLAEVAEAKADLGRLDDDGPTDVFPCPDCGFENEVTTGRFGITETSDGGVAVHQITIHGSVSIAEGDTLAEALRNTADEVDT